MDTHHNLMKTHIRPLVLALVAILSATTQAADTPAAIAADYRKAADTALTRLNTTLDAEAAKVAASLLAQNDAAAVATLTDQVQAKRAGEPVPQPLPQVATLFAGYDRARATALAPVQQSTLRRIDAMLASSDGKKVEIVAELAKLKTDVQAGSIPAEAPKVPVEWTYHQTPTGKPDASIKLNPDGVFIINDGSETKTGKWKASRKRSIITITLDDDVWEVAVKDGLGTIQRNVGTRYMRVVTNK
jgi:hypothetical protein